MNKSILPVLLIAFNRPDLFHGLIENIREFQPSKVYVSIDGPRENNISDQINIDECIKLVSTIDWRCSIFFRYSSINLGVGIWPRESINWVLSREKHVLILEDDVRISKTFYLSANLLVDIFKTEKKIFSICAWNIVTNTHKFENEDFLYSNHFSGGGGWVTWAEKWNNYYLKEIDINLLTLLKIFRKNGHNIIFTIYEVLNIILEKKYLIKSWDYRVSLITSKYDLIHIIPRYNTSNNVGMGIKSSHSNFIPNLDVKDFNLEKFTNKVNNYKNNKRYDKLYRRIRCKIFILSVINKLLTRLK